MIVLKYYLQMYKIMLLILDVNSLTFQMFINVINNQMSYIIEDNF